MSDFDTLRAKFDDYYYQKIWPKLVEKESLRLKHLYRFWILVFIMCFLLPAFIVKLWGDFIYSIFLYGSSEDIESVVKLFLLAVTVILAIVGAPIVAYKAEVKSSIIEDFINFFGSFQHFSARKTSDDEIKQSRLFPAYDRRVCDDYFCGTYKNTPMVIAEEEMSRKQGKYRNTVFKGIIITLDLPKPVSGQTIVLDDRGLFNFLHKTGGDLQRIALEDVVFEKEFEVFGTNQIEARFLLTTAFMEQILKVRDTFKGKKIKFSFRNNRLMIAVSTSEDMFEPSSLFKRSTDRRPVNTVLEQFISVFAVADILKLTQQ